MKEKQPNPLRILLHSGGWTPNIGNAFLQLGAMALMRQAVPDAEIYLASALPAFFLADRSYCSREVENCPVPDPRQAIDMVAYGDYDVFVSAGMVICSEYRRILENSLRRAASAGKKVLFLGAGAAGYDEHERQIFEGLIDKIEVIGFRSRDPASFKIYHKSFRNATSGIDCAWFLPDTYKPLPLSLGSYSVFSFHVEPEPADIPPGRLIRTHHFVMDPVPCSYLTRGPVLLSDRPEDYLNLYAGAVEVHTDRVHAAVAALAYGRRARLYGTTPRAGLFDAVGAGAVKHGLTEVDEDRLASAKRDQVLWVRQTLASGLRPCADPGSLVGCGTGVNN